MIRFDENESSLKDLNVAQIKSYLLSNGWEQLQHPNEKLLYFSGPQDDFEQPIKFALPSNEHFLDYPRKVADLINLLAALYDRDPRNLVAEISHKLRDILKARTLYDTARKLLSLDEAYYCLGGLRSMVAYAGSAEREPRPVVRRMNRLGDVAVQQFNFGHTFEGSFGFSIESPSIPDSFATFERPSPPLSRRVVERIMRGLIDLKHAEQERDSSILIDNFEYGLNANMCEGLMTFYTHTRSDVEFDVDWAPNLQPNEYVRSVDQVVVTRQSLTYLRTASVKLREGTQRFTAVIDGQITHLSKFIPADESATSRIDVERRVTVYCLSGDYKNKNFYVYLSKSDYDKACDAHKAEQMVRVFGLVEKAANNRLYMFSPKKFEVLDK